MKIIVNTEKDFMSLAGSGVMKVTGFGSSAFGMYNILSEPERSGDIPKILVSSLEKERQNEPAFFIHLVDGRLLTDETLNTVCEKEERVEIIVVC